MVQTNLSMFLKEDTLLYGENNTYVHHLYIQEIYSILVFITTTKNNCKKLSITQ